MKILIELEKSFDKCPKCGTKAKIETIYFYQRKALWGCTNSGMPHFKCDWYESCTFKPELVKA
jgi:hypothetical protein